MQKRIAVTDLKVGMYIVEFCGSWMEHPFWRSKFVLDTDADLQRVQESSIREVWIDASKGLDVAGGTERAAADSESEQRLEASDTQPPRDVAPVSAEREMARAAKICAKSKEAVFSMFQEARMGKAVDAASAMPLVEEITASVARNPGALISLARLKTADDYTYMHSVAVCALMIALARQLNLDEAQTRAAGLAGLLHDLGKMAIPPEILNKPGKLTDEEFTIVKNHPTAGHEMLLGSAGVHPSVLDVCLHHHEKTDGSGYPKGLKADEISLMAKMGAVCDVYDAITSNRPYKAGWDPAESLKRMAEWARGHFDERIFQAFVTSVGIYPTGSLVRLQSGRLGVVIEQSDKSLLTPRVKVFFSTKAKAYLKPEIIDLSRQTQDKIAARENAATWGITNLDALWASPEALATVRG